MEQVELKKYSECMSVELYVRPGPPVARRLPNHRRGIPRADGRLPSSVTKANTMLDNAIEIMGAALERGALGGFESPVSRGAGSAFSIEGREDHASMWHDPELIKFHKKYRMTGVAFDQCRTTEAGAG